MLRLDKMTRVHTSNIMNIAKVGRELYRARRKKVAQDETFAT